MYVFFTFGLVFRNILNQAAHTVQTYATPSSPQPGIAGQSGRGASVVSNDFFVNSFSNSSTIY